MQAHLQPTEIEAVLGGHDDLAVDHGARRQLLEKYGVELWEVAVERSQVATLDEDVVLVPKYDRAKAIPLGLEEKVAVMRHGVGDFGQHRLDRWCDGHGLGWHHTKVGSEDPAARLGLQGTR